MNHMSEYLKHKVLRENLIASTAYVALFNETTEVNKASYARQAATFVTPSNGQTSNTADVLFPIANEAWGNITHIAIFDAATGGNLLFKSAAEFVKSIEISSQYKIPKNYLIIRLK
ncbi:hypothetical protein [Lysinibacillus sp. 3P01SB]|uniref:phage tail fiber protein n=1 Tax=Lysinibacillus sp. 3P01SB TaxID=3132284 RepID=UPI0039A5B14C